MSNLNESLSDNALYNWAEGVARKIGNISLYTYLVVLLFAVGIAVAFNYYISGQNTADSILWNDVEQEGDLVKLMDFAEKHRGEMVGNIATLRIARIELNTNGLLELGTWDGKRMKAAIESIVSARKRYLDIVDKLGKAKEFQIEAWLGAAKAEETLLGITPTDKPNDPYLGKADQAIIYYKKALQLMDENSVEAKQLKEKIVDFEKNKDSFTDKYVRLYKSIAPFSSLVPENPSGNNSVPKIDFPPLPPSSLTPDKLDPKNLLPKDKNPLDKGTAPKEKSETKGDTTKSSSTPDPKKEGNTKNKSTLPENKKPEIPAIPDLTKPGTKDSKNPTTPPKSENKKELPSLPDLLNKKK